MIQYLFLSMTKSVKTRLIEEELNKPYLIISMEELTVEQAKDKIKQINFDNCKLVVQIYPDEDNKIDSKGVENYLKNWLPAVINFILSETNIKDKFSIVRRLSQSLNYMESGGM